MRSNKRLVLLALMVAQALVLSIVESWIPVPVPFPGVKLGLANIITLVVIIFFGFRDALMVVLVRVMLASMFTGGIIVLLFSVAGGILSTIVMALLYQRLSKYFSIIGISVAGAVAHNTGQLGVASFIMKELSVMAYLPILLVSGIITGIFVGMCSLFLIKLLKKFNFLRG